MPYSFTRVNFNFSDGATQNIMFIRDNFCAHKDPTQWKVRNEVTEDRPGAMIPNGDHPTTFVTSAVRIRKLFKKEKSQTMKVNSKINSFTIRSHSA